MSYTIADLNEAIENEETEWEGSWSEFSESIDSTLEVILDDDGKPVTKEVTYSWAGGRVIVETQYRDKGWRGVEIPNIGRIEFTDSFGGEGQGDDLWFVFKVTDSEGNEKFFRRQGYWASYDGGYYEGPTVEVYEAKQTIKVWLNKK